MNEEIGTLPALKSLGKLADLRPVVVVDTREQDPLPIVRLPVVREALRAGDYSFRGGEEYFAVERKSIADLVGCCVDSNRERFEWELHRLRGFHFRRLLVIGSHAAIERGEYRSQMRPKAVLATLSAFEARYAIPVVYAATPDEGATLVEHWVYWSAREIVVSANILLQQTQSAESVSPPPEAEGTP